MTASLHPRVAEGTVLTSALDTRGEQYATNRTASLAVLDQLEEQLDLVRAGGGERYAAGTASAAGCWPASASSCCWTATPRSWS